ncbi:SURF1 family protein [Aquipuribacter hungaricus]|uniref:SURF1-like protein n=1 Tax=Aquipuribacter hungaricus TaxID=545624 RepID=A0ABV7WK86_9MICO
MVRTLLTWRWAALTLVLVAAVAGMVLLGRWQWERSVPEAPRAAVDLATVEAASLPDVVALAGTTGAAVPETAAGDLVAATGRWRTDRTLLVADRDLDGRPGRWAVTALEVQGPDGPALLPVVRGWLPSPAGSPAQTVDEPAGAATVVGWLQQSEPLDVPAEVVQPEGVVPLLAAADLANRWPEALVPGFVVTAPTPSQAAGADLELLPGPPAEDTGARDWRNLAYSAQWFVFAGFAVVLWWRMLRDDAARTDPRRRDLADLDDETDPTGPPGPDASTDPTDPPGPAGTAPRERTPA